MPNVDAGDVVREFYRVREEKTGKRPPRFSHAPALAAARRLLETLKEAGASDPCGYIRWRWEAAQHAGHVIGIESLVSQSAVTRWAKYGHGHALAAANGAKLTRLAGSVQQQAVKGLRILTPGMEAVKYPYLTTGRAELCLAEIELSGGFHPSSRYCPTCPVAVRCAAQLYRIHGFDVVSLRAGRLQMLPKEVAAAAVR